MNTGDTQSTPQPASAASDGVPQIPSQPQDMPTPAEGTAALPDTILALGVKPIGPDSPVVGDTTIPTGDQSAPAPVITDLLVPDAVTATQTAQTGDTTLPVVSEVNDKPAEASVDPLVVPEATETTQVSEVPSADADLPVPTDPTIPDAQQIIGLAESPAIPAHTDATVTVATPADLPAETTEEQHTPAPTDQSAPPAPDPVSDNPIQPESVSSQAAATQPDSLVHPEPAVVPTGEPEAVTPSVEPATTVVPKPSGDGHISADIAGFVAAATPVAAAAVQPPVITDVIASAQSASPPMMHADQPPATPVPEKKRFRIPFIAAGGFLVFAVVAGGVILSVANGQNASTDIRSRAASEQFAGVAVEEKVSQNMGQQVFEFILDAVSLKPETQLQQLSMSVLFTRSSPPVLGEMTDESEAMMEPTAESSAAETPAAVCWDQVHEMEEQFFWPDSCRGQAGALVCEAGDMLLTPEEHQEYTAWIENGRVAAPECDVTVSADGTVIPNTPPPGYFVRELYHENGVIVTTDMGDLLEFDAIDVQHSELGDSFTLTVTARPKDPTDTQKLAQLIGRVPLVSVHIDKPDADTFYTATMAGGSVKGNMPGLPLGEMEFVRSL